MTYSERFSDQERSQIYVELVMQNSAYCLCGESAVLGELLSRDHDEATKQETGTPLFSWSGIFRLPFFGRPSLT